MSLNPSVPLDLPKEARAEIAAFAEKIGEQAMEYGRRFMAAADQQAQLAIVKEALTAFGQEAIRAHCGEAVATEALKQSELTLRQLSLRKAVHV